jgi:hypothetical protein
MGKSKRRILHKGINDQISNLTRGEALSKVVFACNTKRVNGVVKNLVSLFGFSAEELLEAGAQYEDVLILQSFLGLK